MNVFYWDRPGDQRPEIRLQLGFLCVKPSGEISVIVDDGYYNGRISREDAQKLYLELKKVFESG